MLKAMFILFAIDVTNIRVFDVALLKEVRRT